MGTLTRFLITGTNTVLQCTPILRVSQSSSRMCHPVMNEHELQDIHTWRIWRGRTRLPIAHHLGCRAPRTVPVGWVVNMRSLRQTRLGPVVSNASAQPDKSASQHTRATYQRGPAVRKRLRANVLEEEPACPERDRLDVVRLHCELGSCTAR